MRDKLLLAFYRYARWRYRGRSGTLTHLPYLDKLFTYFDNDELVKHYTPSLGLRTNLIINYPNAEVLLDRFSTDLERIKRSEYINPTTYERKLTNIDDWLVDNKNRPYDLVAFIALIKSYIDSYSKIYYALDSQSEWRLYYARKMDAYLQDIQLFLETVLEITH